MVMPIYDHNPFKWPQPPYVMWSLVAINFAVFGLQSALTPAQNDVIEWMGSVIPASFTGASLPGTLPAPLTLITSMFLHGNFMHVFGNMIFLFVFGDDIEEAIGHWRFLLFYFGCGIVAAGAFIASEPHARIELFGASGAVAGVIAAYLLFRPCAKVTALLGLIPLRVRAYWIIGGWALWQLIEAATNVRDGVAYWGHVGGLAAGAVLFAIMRPAGVRLFDCAHSEPVLVDGRYSLPR
jgi:membrane associated rhomboid family serine protease